MAKAMALANVTAQVRGGMTALDPALDGYPSSKPTGRAATNHRIASPAAIPRITANHTPDGA